MPSVSSSTSFSDRTHKHCAGSRQRSTLGTTHTARWLQLSGLCATTAGRLAGPMQSSSLGGCRLSIWGVCACKTAKVLQTAIPWRVWQSIMGLTGGFVAKRQRQAECAHGMLPNLDWVGSGSAGGFPQLHSSVCNMLLNSPCLLPCLPVCLQLCNWQLHIWLDGRHARPQGGADRVISGHSLRHNAVCPQHQLQLVHRRTHPAGPGLLRPAHSSLCAGNRVGRSYVSRQGGHRCTDDIPHWGVGPASNGLPPAGLGAAVCRSSSLLLSHGASGCCCARVATLAAAAWARSSCSADAVVASKAEWAGAPAVCCCTAAGRVGAGA
jgi:hypothetical protein